MKKILFSTIFLSVFTLFLNAENINLDYDNLEYYKPSPTKAFMYSMVFPGAGYFYISNLTPGDRKYNATGIKFLTLGLASAYFLYNRIEAKDSIGTIMAAGIMGRIKIWEFGNTIEDAEIERHKIYKKAQYTKGGKQ